uniref:DNA-directed RNA polymerase subunit n=1 Tax=Megaviridae environmental sample TaxID=1737588 RepID=A0A5J6VMH2_9VIRU|nr:MAG: RNA polymerase Rpb1, domain 5 [Megaviridae environmental sample]
MSRLELYNENIKQIKSIDWNIFTNSLVKKYSCVKAEAFGINKNESYNNYDPVTGGLVDLRLGTCDIYLNCLTCGLNSIDCPGHFGHTELAEPVFHFGFITHLITILKIICLKCSNILVKRTPEILNILNKLSSKNKIKELKDLVQNISFCPHCGTPVPKIKKEVKESAASIKILVEREVGNMMFNESTGDSVEQKKTLKEYISPRDCYNILINISDTDCYLLGFNPELSKPHDLILTRFPIPPVSIRPTAKIDFMSASTMEDSLTLKIADIVTSNNRVRNQLNKDKDLNFDTHTLLQYHIATYFDNESASLPKSEFKTGNKPTKSISDRIKAKGGRVRNNLMGKRVDFSGRSVITSDPNISIEQVGVPLKIAKDLTIPEEVTPQNIQYLTRLVKNGRENYPGANFVFRNININGKNINQKIDLKYRKKNIKLVIGDVVERHIINDDYVLFNRQPTLHKPSMMGHRVHVLERDDANTLRMNVCVTGPYNADFDGDEMNIHLGQSIQSKNELKRIANVKLQIIGAKDSNPIIGCVQDTLAGAYLLTSQNNEFSYNEVANLLCVAQSDTGIKKFTKKIKGDELFSHIIPNGLNIVKKKDDQISFLIKNGKLEKGILNKAQLSTKKNSIIQFIWNKYGPKETTQFIDNSQRLILAFLMNKGFTIGFKDTLVRKDIDQQIKELINNKVLQSKYQISQFENDEDKLPVNLIEQQLTSEMSSMSLNTSKIILESLPESNNFKIFIKSGSKGSPINIAQIAGCVGQVSVSGSRIQKKVNNRTIPYFHQNDDSPEARGFVKSNFGDGLSGHEFYFHTMAGREGLIDTAIKTAETGYIQRKLIKALEDIKVFYDGTVRTSKNIIIQYVYGENGISQTKQTKTSLNCVKQNNKELETEYTFTSKEANNIKFTQFSKYNKIILEKIKEFRDTLRDCHIKSTQNYKIMTDTFNIPININRLTVEFSKLKRTKNDLDPFYVIDQIDNIINSYTNRLILHLKETSNILKKDDTTMKYLLNVCLYEFLHPKKCIYKYNLTKADFDSLIKEINLNLISSIVEPGEMVGIVAAQSVGEPTSQMTLNTKHFAGVAGKGTANMGVSRIKEILNYSKNIKTPQMNIYFNKKYNKDKSAVSIISSYLKQLTLKDLIEKAEIFYTIDSTDELSTMIKNDNVKNPFYISNTKDSLSTMPFLFRLKINLEAMMDKETSLLDIKTKFITYWYRNLSNTKTLKKMKKDIISKIINLAILDNSNDIIHIRFNIAQYNYTILTNLLNITLETVTLKGIENISSVDVINERKIDFTEEGDMEISKEFLAITAGININELKLIKGIDFDRTIMNDINTVYIHYGIEAARQILIHELAITYNSGGSEVNHTHMSLLVDLMTFNGNIISIDRHGLNKIDSDPMSKASFEKTMEHFINATLYSETDSMKSVSSKIMTGHTIEGGTSGFDIFLDIDKIKNSEYVIDEAKGRTSYIPIEKDVLFDDIINNDNVDYEFFLPS